MPHRTLKFTTVETIYRVSDLNQLAPGTIDIEVKWQVLSPKQAHDTNNDRPYLVTITPLNGGDLSGRIYSLLTLGFQACDWENYIYLPAGVELLDENEQTIVDRQNRPVTEWEISRADRVWDTANRRYLPNEDLIWFLKFNGRGPYTLALKDVNRPLCGITYWSDGTAGDGHDDTPPKNPPD